MDSPSKIGGYERGRIEDSLELAIRLLAVLLTRNDKYLDVLIKLFSRNPTYYAGIHSATTVTSLSLFLSSTLTLFDSLLFIIHSFFFSI